MPVRLPIREIPSPLMIASFSKWLTALLNIYFCNDSAEHCNFLAMADVAAPDVAARMLPALTDHNRAFWTGGANGTLMISWCPACERYVQPPAADCPECEGAMVPRAVSGRGSVYTYTVNHQPFMPGVPVPYVIAIVALDEQDDLRLATNIVDCEPDSVRIGLEVQVRFERHEVEGESVYYPVFAPRG